MLETNSLLMKNQHMSHSGVPTMPWDVSGVPNYINEAVPFFFLFIFVELLVSIFRGHRSLYRWTEVVASLSMGIAQQLSSIWYHSLTIGPYIYLFRHYRLVPVFDAGWFLNHVVTFFLTDMGYYWFHRYAHVFHAVWAGHSVHHTGEDYNLATALRQGALQPVFSWVFYLPMALIGIPPPLFFMHTQWNTIYQFFIHTDEIGRMGPLEYVLNTPSHHRMHHRPPGNCNYGGVLIIFDKLFGTFMPEDEHIDLYGLAKQLNTFDPIEANLSHWLRMSNIRTGEASGDGLLATLWRWILILPSQRVRHPFVFLPQALFDELPSTAYLNGGDPKAQPVASSRVKRNSNRRKWTGVFEDDPSSPRPRLFTQAVFLSYLTVHFLLILSLSYLLMLCVTNVSMGFSLGEQPWESLMCRDGLTDFLHRNRKQVFVLFCFMVCLHGLHNIGTLSDRGVNGVNDIFGEPGRLAVIGAFFHLLAYRQTIGLSTCIVVSAGIALPWLITFHVTRWELARRTEKR